MEKEENIEETNIEMFKLKRLLNKLDKMKGSGGGTSMITLIINHKDNLITWTKTIVEEVGKATNIKSRVTRQNVQDALVSCGEKLKLYNRTPQNGLVIFCGLASFEGQTDRMVKIDLTPFKPINTSMYKCDNIFHTEDLRRLLEDNDRFGYIVVDGSGALFGSLQGNTRNVINKFSVDLPKKHGRGGQSKNRFERLRREARYIYLKKVAEMATNIFVPNGQTPNIKGLILAGSADFKSELEKSDVFDYRLKPIVLKMVDISYGQEQGFNQAIELSKDCLGNVKFMAEKKVVGAFLDEISKDTGKYVFGVKDTLKAIEEGAMDTIIVYEDLDLYQIAVRNAEGELSTKVVKGKEIESNSYTEKEETFEIVDQTPYVEYLLENYKDLANHLEVISDKSSEGNQFAKGFGGLGGILKFKLELEYEENSQGSDSDSFNEDDFI